jgi:hypothetical protein
LAKRIRKTDEAKKSEGEFGLRGRKTAVLLRGCGDAQHAQPVRRHGIDSLPQRADFGGGKSAPGARIAPLGKSSPNAPSDHPTITRRAVIQCKN